MRPLTSRAEWPKICVFDLEAAKWVNISLVCHIDEYGNRVNFSNIPDYLDWLFSDAFKGDVVFAHAGGRYDNRFLLEHVVRKGWDFRFHLTGGTIVILTINNGKRVIKFGDSYRLMPDALEKIGQTVGLHKIDLNPNMIEELPFEDVLAYCYRDCEVVLKGLQSMRDTLCAQGGDFAFTLASIAARYLRRIPIDYYKFAKRKNGKWVARDDFIKWDTLCYQAYYGGRCDIFWRGLIKGVIYWYDIVSSYPASMRLLLPVYSLGWKQPPKNKTYESLKKYFSHTGISDCTVFVPHTEYITCLPVKSEDGRLIFPTGLVSGLWTNIELMRALELGYQFIDVRGQQRFEGAHLLKSFVDKFYQLRQKAKDVSDEFGSYAFKILLNSSYGKTVETVDRVSYLTGGEIVRATEEGAKIEMTPCAGVFMAKSEEIGAYRHSAMGAYITAYSRLRLFNMAHELHSMGAEIYYMDTDSLMTNFQITTTGKGLGDWELVDVLSEIEILLPKVYRAVSATGKKKVYKCKGCPIVRKWESDDVSEERWHAFKNQATDYSDKAEELLGKDGITQIKTDIREGRLTPRRLEGPCKNCKKTPGKDAGHTCTICNGTGKVHKPLVRTLRSGDKKRQWNGNQSRPLAMA